MTQQEWFHELWNDSRNMEHGNKLRLYRLFKERMTPDAYTQQGMSRNLRQLLAKFRSGTLPIAIETGRYQGIQLEDRICKFCATNKIEDEIHVLVECDLYKDLRFNIDKHMHTLNKDFMSLPSLVKFLNIMSSNTAQYLLAKYLYFMLKRRKIHDLT